MNRHARTLHRLTAATSWLASFAWLAWAPDSPGIHRTILSVAIAATISAVLDVRLADAREVARVAAIAGYQQAQRESRAEL